jgi:hypothetical protein
VARGTGLDGPPWEPAAAHGTSGTEGTSSAARGLASELRLVLLLLSDLVGQAVVLGMVPFSVLDRRRFFDTAPRSIRFAALCLTPVR